jgi:4'-phosphopantetheinyl transferase
MWPGAARAMVEPSAFGPVPNASPFHVWRVDLREVPAAADLLALSAAELDRARRFVFERDRRRYLAAHCALRRLLGEHIASPPHRLAFGQGPFGKPHLVDLPDCRFNMSHSDDEALVAIGELAEVGIDLEVLRPMGDAAALADRNFTANERALLAAAAADQRDRAFLSCWVRKEAVLKAIGSGLSIEPQTFEAGVAPEARTIGAGPFGGQRVQVQSLPLGAGRLGAVAWLIG